MAVDAVAGLENLARLGAEVARMRFSYKLPHNQKRQYWEERIAEHREYFGKSREYYEQAHALMRSGSPGRAEQFQAMLSKFDLLKASYMDALEKIRQNPTIMAKAGQQSQWSRDVRDGAIECGNRCLEQEKAMSSHIREFFGGGAKQP